VQRQSHQMRAERDLGQPQRWRRRPAVVLPIALAAGLASACAHRPTPVSHTACRAAETAAARLSATWAGQTVSGTVQITARDGVLRGRVVASIAVVAPDRLRLELSDALGQTQLLALVSRDALAFWTVADGWLSGAPALTTLPLPAAVWPNLPRLLLAVPCADAECAPSYEDAGATTILLRCGHGTPEWRWDARRQQVVGAHLPPLRISYLDADTGNELHPRDLDVDLGQGRSLSLRWQGFRFDRDLPPELFLRIPHPETVPGTDPSVERP
jgi:hypothetical protein